VGLLTLAAATRLARAMPSTDAKQARVWGRWLTFLGTINRAHDPFLHSLDTESFRHLRPLVIGGFTQAFRTGQLQLRGRQSVVASTVQSDVGSLVQAFRTAKQSNPSLDSDGKLSALLSWQYAGYASFDPPPKHEKAIGLDILMYMKANTNSDLEHHTANLALAAFFFACRSCEYLKVKGARRTKTLRVVDIQFRQGSQVLAHDSTSLHLADTVTVTFQDQKNRAKIASRTAWKTSNPLACPVVAFASAVRRARDLPGSSDQTLIYNFSTSRNRAFQAVTDINMISQLRFAVTMIGEDKLDYKAKDVGTHSIRSGCAMTLVLSNHAAWRIMLTGRWKPQAFLCYIREQIQQFSKGVSERMTTNPDFYHVPDINQIDDITCTNVPNAAPLDAGVFDGRASRHTDTLNISFLG
jgi:hypothetical protein